MFAWEVLTYNHKIGPSQNNDDLSSLTTEKEDEVLIVRKMLELGYQVELDAVRQLLDQEGEPEPVLRILESVAKSKVKRHGKQFVIGSKDVRPFLKAKADRRQTEEVVPVCEVLFDPTRVISPTADTSGYVKLFNSRLERMSLIIRNRQDFFQIEKLNAIKTPSSGKKVLAKVVGLVVSKRVSGGYVSLTLEDDSGYLRLMCTDDAIRKAEEVLIDEFVLVEVESLPRGYYARNIYHPDVPERARKVSSERAFALFASDLHIGSPDFDKEAFQKMVGWLNGDFGEMEIVSRTGYLVLNGDLIENPLARDGRSDEEGIEASYDVLADFLAKIRRDVRVLVVPGETDATRMALPQPAIIRKYAKRLYEMKNVVMLGNPSMVRIHGVDVLLYHGQSLDEVFKQLQSTSASRPCTGIKALLRARHVAPTYGGLTALAPEREDLLIIESIPDIMHCGHVGLPDEDIYRGTLLLSTPSWTGDTKSVLHGQGRAALVDLSTLEVLWRA
jgi:DNA polymerase II small subunit